MKERGMALAVVLLALTVIGALVAMAFHVGHLEHRIGRSSLNSAQALEAAEAGVAVVLGDWETFPQLGALAINETTALPAIALGDHAAFQATVLRLTDGLYLIRSQGTRSDAAGGLLAQRLVGMLARAEGGVVVPLMQRSWVQLY
jgi:hypothetical protein